MAEGQALEQQAFQFVRKHSLQVAEDNPNNEVAQALGEFETHERSVEAHNPVREWQRWIDSGGSEEAVTDDDLALLQKECKELIEVWLKLQKKYPECDGLLPDSRGPPSIARLQSVVTSTLDSRESRQSSGLGRTKQQFFGFCDTLTAYLSLFSLIPQGSLYTSLFVGVISSLVKASARHDQNGEGFSRALAEISADMKFSQKQGAIHPTDRMKKLVILLYVRYAKFLCHAMNWYHSKWGRFKAAMDQSFYTREIRQKVNEVKDVVKDIEREASLETQEMLGETHQTVMQLGHMITEVRRQNRIADQNHNLSAMDLGQQLDSIRLAIGEMAQTLAAATVTRQLYASHSSIVQGRAPDQIEDVGTMSDESQTKLAVQTYRRQEAEEASRSLMKFIGANTSYTSSSSTDLAHPIQSTQRVTGEIVTRLQTWMSEPKSQMLWIMSPPFSSTRHEASIAAEHMIFVAQSREIPHLTVSVGRLETTHKIDQTPQTSRLTMLLYVLIRQLTLLIPENFEDTSDIPALLASLEGTPKSTPAALEALRKLLRHAPSLLICVIDGLQLLDHPDSEQHMNNLLSILHVSEDGKVLKVLLTSEGFFSSGANLAIDERLDCLSSPRRKPGRGRPGARNLDDISFNFDQPGSSQESR